ncbi:hypothetical protein ARMGADRAFT_1035967 [Armillaria gallica]|uniref:Uncharacterized protein n=1 Tax=Armillaria gallica TaxID=47427 RepID=A0A2H3D3K9_ARMGA|nr:hypothetical protein ARMGADRAFT_1035967 [Armillaria gallica]
MALPALFLGASSTLHAGQTQTDVHVFNDLNSPVFPKVRLVNRSVLGGIGYLYAEYRTDMGGPWLSTYPYPFPGDLFVRTVAGPALVPVNVWYPGQRQWARIGWHMVLGEKYDLLMWPGQNGMLMPIHYWQHQRWGPSRKMVPITEGQAKRRTGRVDDKQLFFETKPHSSIAVRFVKLKKHKESSIFEGLRIDTPYPIESRGYCFVPSVLCVLGLHLFIHTSIFSLSDRPSLLMNDMTPYGTPEGLAFLLA